MLVAPVLWSSAGVVTRHVERAGAFEQVMWRSLFAFLFVLSYLLVRRSNPWTAITRAGWPGVFSGAMWAVMFTAFVVALSLTSIANTLVVTSVAPLLTALLAKAFLSDPLPGRTWVAAGAAAAGIGFMFNFSVHGGSDLAGMAIAFLVPCAAAANLVVLRAVRGEVDLVPAVMLGAVLSCLVALPLAAPLQATGRDVLLLALLGVFQLGLPCVLMVIASRALLAPEIALLALLEVVLGPLWAWLGVGETPAQGTLVGGAIVIAALAANEAAALRQRRPGLV